METQQFLAALGALKIPFISLRKINIVWHVHKQELGWGATTMSYNMASFIGLLLCAAVATFSIADETDAVNVQQRREALDWLDTHIGEQQLLKPDDFKALFKKVGSMSDAEVEEWLAETRQLRKALQSQAWRETRAWLREFLAVQAIYSDEEIDEFKTQAANMSPTELLDSMHLIRRKHQSLISMHAASERARRTNLRLRNDLIRRQQQTVNHAATIHSMGPIQHVGHVSPRPVRSSYAERMNVYRRHGFWPGGVGSWPLLVW